MTTLYNTLDNSSLSNILMKDNISPIDTDFLKELIRSELEPTWREFGATPPDMSWITPLVVEELFKEIIHHTRGNKTEAAKILGINRGSFSSKIEQLQKGKLAL